MSFEVRVLKDEEVPEDYKDFYDSKEETVIGIFEDNQLINFYSDFMEPEDVRFGRDLNWVFKELNRAYEKGFEDGLSTGKIVRL